MANIQLLVYSSGLTTGYGQIELYGNEPINIKMSVADIKDVKTRKSTFSKSFVVPGTVNNNQLFSHIFEIGADSVFDPRKKTPASLIIDSIPVMNNGNLQLTGINVDEQNNVEYEVSVFDNTQVFIDNVGDAELTALDYSDLNHVWNYTNVVNSWTGSSQSYFYPLIDYGYDYSLADMNSGLGVKVEQMLPSIQVRTVLSKMFDAAGYTWESDFLDSDYFKNLYLPFNGSPALNQEPSFAINRSFLAHYTGQTATTISLPIKTFMGGENTPVRQSLTFENDSTYPNFDNGGLYNTLSSVYTSDTYSIQSFTVTLQTQFTLSANTNIIFNGVRHFVRFFRSTYMGGTAEFYITSDNGTSSTGITTTSYSTPLLNGSSPLLYPCQPNETFWVKFDSTVNLGPVTTTGNTATWTLYSSGTSFYNTVSTQAILGQLIDYVTFIPKKIKQIDLFNSIITMHNLYVTTSRTNDKTLVIKPRDDYYASGVTKDWSSKLDLTTNVDEKLLSEMSNKQFIFTYKKDADYYNTDYSTATNKIFGDEYFVMDNEFVKGDKKLEVIFSPTPSIPVLDSGGFVPVGANPLVCNEFVVPKIGKVDSNNNFGRTDFNIRILQKNPDNLLPLTGTNTWKLSGQTFTNYPYLGMLNHPLTGTTDIAFGSVDYVYYTLNYITDNNLVNKYWRSYLNQISDKNSKLITANFYLTPADIQKFDFSDTIYVEGLTPEGGHYFIVNSIDYSPTSNGPSKVELIKTIKQSIDVTTSRIVPSVFKPIPLQSLTLGGGQTFSTGSIAIGPDSVIGAGSPRSFIMGEGNTVEGGSPRSMIVGSGSTILAGAQGSMVFGDGITASTPNTVYVPNIVISSGGTFNGLPLSAITSGSTLWAAGNGVGSILQNNDTGNISSGDYSIAEGNATIASGAASHSEGFLTTSIGDFSHAEGRSSISIGSGSHAEGRLTTAIGDQSHSEGGETIASGDTAHAEGYYTTAGGNYSHAGGINSIASGQASFVHGSGSTASGIGTVVLGTNITGTSANTVYVNNLVISGNVTSIPILARGYVTDSYNNTGNSRLRLSGETYDTYSAYSASSSTFIVPQAGYYNIQANIEVESQSGPAQEFAYITLNKNGVDISSSIVYTTSANEFNTIALNDIIQANIGDELDLWITVSSPFYVIGSGGADDNSWWTIHKLV